MTHGTSTPQPQHSPALPEWLASQLAYRAAWAEQPWPEGVIARYLTIGGGIVDLTYRFTVVDPPESFATRAACAGCPSSKEFSHWQLVRDMTVDREERDPGAADSDARDWAQAHAETCRALPRPAGA